MEVIEGKLRKIALGSNVHQNSHHECRRVLRPVRGALPMEPYLVRQHMIPVVLDLSRVGVEFCLVFATSRWDFAELRG